MEVGETIAGKYRLNRLIGTGGMASVWSATNIFTEREFAIKFMLPQVARTPEAARRFLLEAKISARINHPNIIEVIDVGQAEDGSLFLVMELLAGQSLETGIRRQVPPMRVYDFVGLMFDVAQALAAAHHSGVIHRDLKPTNIFLHQDREGMVVAKILDFGVSKILEEETNQSLTVAGTVLGSPLYMSPEQAMGAPNIDGRTDIFAFGAIMFEALTATRAYDAPNFNALIVTIATTQPRKIDEIAPHLPECLRSVVRDCLVTDRNKRVASFEQLSERLSKVLAHLEENESDLRLPVQPPSSSPGSDPDLTNALPVGRRSERALRASQSFRHSTVPPRSSPPAAAFSSPWSMPPLSNTQMSPPRRRALLLASSAAVLVSAGLVLAAFTVDRSSGKAAVGAAASLPPAEAAVQTHAATAPVTEPSVINVDALPVAPNHRASASAPAAATAQKTMGHLSVAASPGWCNISVDGVRHGATPVAKLELAAGAHKLECAPPSGKPRTAQVTVPEGALAKYKFSLDD